MSRRTHVDGPHPRSKSDWPSNATDAAAPELARNWRRVLRRTAILTSRPEGSPGDPPYPDALAPVLPAGIGSSIRAGAVARGSSGRRPGPPAPAGAPLPRRGALPDPLGENGRPPAPA